MTSFTEVKLALEAGGWNPRTNGDARKLSARCPAHNGVGQNLSVGTGDGGLALVTCHSRQCTFDEVRHALHIEKPAKAKAKTKRKYERTTPRRAPDFVYPYRDATGTVVAEMVRWDRRQGEDEPWWGGNKKIVRPRNMRGDLKGLPKGQKYPIYNLPDLLARPDAQVVIVEGEKSVMAAAAGLPGAVIVTSAFGSGSAAKTDWSPLAERDCTMWPDGGPAGAKYADDVRRHVPGLKVVDVADLPDGWDLADPRPTGLDVTARLKEAAPIEGRPGGLIPEGKTVDGLKRCLQELGIEVRFNVRALRNEHRVNGFWQLADDRLVSSIRAEIGKRFHVELKDGGKSQLYFGRETYHDLLDGIVHHRREDAFRVWVESRPAWDGIERIGALLTDNFGADDNAISQWASRYIGLGALQRTYEPGSKLDEMPVLIGKQDQGKSAFAAAWMPPEHQMEWFGDRINLSATEQKLAEALAGRVVVEFAEMAGLPRADIENLKSFITSQNDGQHRAAYARAAEARKRICIFIGTSNDADCLPNDPSGNRRFVPVMLRKGTNVEQLAERDRDQWWAEALHLHREGVRANLPRELKPMAAEAAEDHRKVDTLEDAVREILMGDSEPGNPLREITISELATRMGCTLAADDMRWQKRCANALRANDWDRVRVKRGGSRAYVWRPQYPHVGPDMDWHP